MTTREPEGAGPETRNMEGNRILEIDETLFPGWQLHKDNNLELVGCPMGDVEYVRGRVREKWPTPIC